MLASFHIDQCHIDIIAAENINVKNYIRIAKKKAELSIINAIIIVWQRFVT